MNLLLGFLLGIKMWSNIVVIILQSFLMLNNGVRGFHCLCSPSCFSHCFCPHHFLTLHEIDTRFLLSHTNLWECSGCGAHHLLPPLVACEVVMWIGLGACLLASHTRVNREGKGEQKLHTQRTALSVVTPLSSLLSLSWEPGGRRDTVFL